MKRMCVSVLLVVVCVFFVGIGAVQADDPKLGEQSSSDSDGVNDSSRRSLPDTDNQKSVNGCRLVCAEYSAQGHCLSKEYDCD